MPLFKDQPFKSHAGRQLQFKIECDELTGEDIETIAAIIARTHTFREVHGVPTGGTRLANALQKYCSAEGVTLIVDDVLTTGMSMLEMREKIGGECVGIVIFARGVRPPWVKAMFELAVWADH